MRKSERSSDGPSGGCEGVAVLAAAALVAATLTAVATNQRNQAEQARLETRARELAAAAVANLEIDPELALLLALESVEATRTDGTLLPEATEALHRAVISHRQIAKVPADGIASISPDGSRVLTPSVERPQEAHVYDAVTGRVLLTLRGHGYNVADVDYSPDGRLLATAVGSRDDTIVWSAETGEPLLRVPATGKNPEFSGDSRRLVVIDRGSPAIWDISDGRLVASIDLAEAASFAFFDPEGRYLAIATNPLVDGLFTGVVTIWDLELETVVHELSGGSLDLTDIAWGPDGLVVATWFDGSLRAWDAESGERLFTLIGDYLEADVSADGTRLATGGADGVVKLWSLDSASETPIELFTTGAHGARVLNVTLSRNADRLASAGEDGSARIWDVSANGSREWFTVEGGLVFWFSDIALDPTGRWLLASGDDGSVRVFDGVTGRYRYEVNGHPHEAFEGDSALAIRVSPDGNVFASTGSDGMVRIWDLSTGALLHTMQHIENLEAPVVFALWTRGLAFTPDGQTLVTGGNDALIKLWDVETGAPLGTLSGHGAGIRDLDVSPDGTRLVSVSGDGTIRLWELVEQRLLRTIEYPSGDPRIANTVRFSPDGTEFVTAGFDGRMIVWDTASGTQPWSRNAQAGELLVAEWNDAGTQIATSGSDGTIAIWDVDRRVRTLQIRDLIAAPRLVFSPDGSRLASTSIDGLVRMWALDVDDLVRLARERLSRGFTDEECQQYQIDPCPAAG